ncbi:UNVERIFIED_CONTAM: hypothetical protein Sradi_3577200 [Sesamum radiatum]|uniref:Retrotransposon Copia-like N-terminal domain-containing protein n=1 Tax=Sesamum radiatum TaxID=300843 RepID=A0AAW2QGX8_SESRA
MATAEGDTNSTVQPSIQTENEALQLHRADHPGMVLVSAPLTRKNYLNWSYAIKRALRAKMKLGFIGGSLSKPDVNDVCFEKWIRVDSMVTTWILNSILKEVIEVEAYYTNLRRLSDELEVLMPTPQCTCNGCTCGLSKAVADLATFAQLMQFLMGLGEMFDHVRHQLLVMDPIPSVNRAYSMVQSVERQKEVHMEIAENCEHAAMQVRTGNRKDVGFKGDQKRRGFIDKRQQYCEHCAKSGHTKDTSFKIHGTPDWYKDLIEQKRKDAGGSGSGRHFVAQSGERKGEIQVNDDSKELFLKELIKLMRGSGIQSDPIQQVNFSQIDDFAGLGSKQILAVGKLVNDLYVLDKSSFSPATLRSFPLQQVSCLAA